MYDRALLLGHCPSPPEFVTAEWGVTPRALACRCRHWIDIVRGSRNIVMYGYEDRLRLTWVNFLPSESRDLGGVLGSIRVP